jgi:hypothetical protein
MKQNKARIDKRVDRVRSKNPLTVEKFLQGCEVSELLERVNDNRAEISDLFVIYRDKDGAITWNGTPSTSLEERIYLLEQVKVWILQGECDGD